MGNYVTAQKKRILAILKSLYTNMQIKKILLTALVIASCVTVKAQTFWDQSQLSQVKKNASLPVYAASIKNLIEKADAMLSEPDMSVMLKKRVSVSGDKHDYYSQARYTWPNPNTPDGLPYVNRDGESNPEIYELDRYRLSDMCDRVRYFTLAWYFSGEKKYADAAVKQLRVWFLDPETYMNPNFNYAQVRRGHDGDKGSHAGLIDAYTFVEMMPALYMLKDAKMLPKADYKGLKKWFAEFVQWYLTSDLGKGERDAKNNHSIAYDAQVICFARFAGDKKTANAVINEFPTRRLFPQIEPDGSQPQELRRTLSYWYSTYNIEHMVDIMFMAKGMKTRIYDAVSPDGRCITKAMDFLIPYVGKEVSAWPHQQIGRWEDSQQSVCDNLYRIYLFDRTKTNYRDIALANSARKAGDIWFLLYLSPEDAKNLTLK